MKPGLWTTTLGGLLAAALFANGADAVDLRFAHGNSTTSYAHLAAEKFKEHVEEQTGGEITVSLFPAGQLGKSDEMVKGVRLGTIDLHATGNPWMTGFNPVQNVLDIPFIFEDHDHVYRVLDGEVGDKLLGTLEEHDLKGLAFWEIGFRNVINSKRPIETVGDLEGLKIRTTGNKAHIQAFELLGANPQPMPFGEVYLALQTHVVDGAEHPVNEVYAMKFNEVTSHMSLTRHAYTAMVFMMNHNRWNSLSPEQQAVIVDGAKIATAFQRGGLAKENAERLQALKDAGMAVVEDIDREPFRKAVYDQVKATYEAEFGTEITDAIQDAREN